MKKLIIVLQFVFVLSEISIVNAQTIRFERHHEIEQSCIPNEIHEIPGSGYIMPCMIVSAWIDTANNFVDYWKNGIVRIDYDGYIADTIIVRYDSSWAAVSALYNSTAWLNTFRSLRFVSDSNFIAVGETQYFNPLNAYDVDLFIRKYNLNWDTAWQKVISLPDSQLGSPRIINISDGNLLIIGSILSSISGNRFKGFAIKIDTNGNVLWSKRYTSLHNDLRLDAVAETPDHGFIISATDFYGNFFVTNEFYPVIMKIDSVGNLIQQTVYTNLQSSTFYPNALSKTTDGNYVMSYTGFPVHFKCNSNGDTLWTNRIYDFPNGIGYGAISSAAADNGSVVVAGTTKDTITLQWVGALYKLDNDGNVLWKRTYGYPNTSHRMWSIIKSPDDGFLVAGETWCCNSVIGDTGMHTSSLYLYKVDSLGLLVPVGVQEHPPTENTLLSYPYPNPATNQTTFTILVPPTNSSGITGEKGAQLLLFDMQGRQLQKHSLLTGLNNITIDVSSLASGEYLCVLSMDGYNAGGKKFVVQH